MRALGLILAVVVVVRAQKDLIGDLFRESHVEPVLQLLQVCTAAKNGEEINGYRRTISDLMNHITSDSDIIDGEDRFYPERAGDLFEEICTDLEVYLADVAAHLAEAKRFSGHHRGTMKTAGPTSIINTCMAQFQNEEQPIKRGLHRLLQELGLKNIRPEDARKHAESINGMFNKLCEEIRILLEIVPGTTQPTPVDGSWSSWTSGSCSVTCGPGTFRKTRTCTNPTPKYGGQTCSGSPSITASCRRSPCKVHGSWSSWKSGSCSVTCGSGTFRKTRTCTNPTPKYGGKKCYGSGAITAVCRRPLCKVDGVWSAWSSGTCSVTCGTGTRQRTRLCNSPAPKHGGRKCSGLPRMSVACVLQDCPKSFNKYVIGFFKNLNRGTKRLVITTKAKGGAYVNITAPKYAAFSRRVFVGQGSSEMVTLPSKIISTAGKVESKGVLVESTSDISVYAVNEHATTTDVYTALPTSFTDKWYIVSTPKQRTAILAIGQEDNTAITFTLPKKMVGSVVFNGKSYTGGKSFAVKLNMYDTLTIKGGDYLTGTQLQSNKPISVIGGSMCSDVGSSACDYIAQQMLPKTLWLAEYSTVQIPNMKSNMDYYQVVGAKNGMEVFVDKKKVQKIDMGEFASIQIPKGTYSVISTSEPSMVTMYSSGKVGPRGDPFMVSLVTGDMENSGFYRQEFVYRTPVVDTTYIHFISVTVPTMYKSGVLLDGKNLVAIKTTDVRGSPMTVITANISRGKHNLSHLDSKAKFAVYAFGVRSSSSYGFYLV